MKHFTSAIQAASTYVVTPDMSFRDPAFVRIQEALLITMGANPLCLLPSELSVLDNFIRWAIEAKEDSKHALRPLRSGVFTYVNLNEGYSLAVVWADNIPERGPLRLL